MRASLALLHHEAWGRLAACFTTRWTDLHTETHFHFLHETVGDRVHACRRSTDIGDTEDVEQGPVIDQTGARELQVHELTLQLRSREQRTGRDVERELAKELFGAIVAR